MRNEELAILRSSLQQAKKFGMQREFSICYRSFRKIGESVKESCWLALYEWDLLTVDQLLPDVRRENNAS